jgi:hypothetical protein
MSRAKRYGQPPDGPATALLRIARNSVSVGPDEAGPTGVAAGWADDSGVWDDGCRGLNSMEGIERNGVGEGGREEREFEVGVSEASEVGVPKTSGSITGRPLSEGGSL